MKRNDRTAIVFLCCVLAMPTCTKLLSGFHSESMKVAIVMGVMLGAAHVVLRPVIRFVAAPIGCLTLGLIQPVIDMGLIFLCDMYVEGFSVTDPLHMLLAVVLINSVTFIAAGRR